MARRKRFRVYFTADDIVDVSLELDGGAVKGFMLNYRATLGNRWVEVARYDTCHGRLHVHQNWRAPGKQIRDLEPRPDFEASLVLAQRDLERNWPTYRRRMEVKHG